MAAAIDGVAVVVTAPSCSPVIDDGGAPPVDDACGATATVDGASVAAVVATTLAAMLASWPSWRRCFFSL